MQFRDVQIAEDIMQIIAEEVALIKKSHNREVGDIVKIERLSKTYSVIMASNRELFKSGMLGNMDLSELDEKLDNAADEEDEAE